MFRQDVYELDRAYFNPAQGTFPIDYDILSSDADALLTNTKIFPNDLEIRRTFS